jgi:hypothetical protein
LGDDELASCVVLFFRITQYIGCDWLLVFY